MKIPNEPDKKKKTVRLAVTGTRSATDRPWLDREMEMYLKKRNLFPAKDHILLVISGGANGIDTMVDAWARERGIEMINYKPLGVDKYSSKKKWGKANGLRNTVIVNDCTHLLAFPLPKKSRNTWRTIRKAREMNREVSVVRYKGNTYFGGRETIVIN